MARSVRRWSCSAAVVCQALALLACNHAASKVRRPTVRLTTGPPGAGFHRLGERLGAAYVKLLPDTNIEVHTSAGAIANVEAIQRGQAEVGFTFADVAYLAFEGQLKGTAGPFDRLRGIAVMQLTPVTLVVSSHASVGNVRDLRGRRIGLGPPGSGTALTAGLLLQAFGLEPSDVHAEPLPFGEAARRLTAGTLDAMFDNAVYPADSVLRRPEQVHESCLSPVRRSSISAATTRFFGSPSSLPTPISGRPVPCTPSAWRVSSYAGAISTRRSSTN
jgi:TRAP transporter TAXI family solute receptor